MENSFQTSFIPKKPIVNNGGLSGGKKTTSIFMVISVLIIVLSGLAAGGLYFYKGTLEANKNELYSSLMKVKESFDEKTIAELDSYDKKSTVVRQILDQHKVLSPLFEAINEYTLTSIQYTKFDHTLVGDIFTVSMSGTARDYKSISLQADTYVKNKPEMFKNLVFSNLTKDKNNYVTFNVEFSLDPNILLYKNNISSPKSSPVVTENKASTLDTTMATNEIKTGSLETSNNIQ